MLTGKRDAIRILAYVEHEKIKSDSVGRTFALEGQALERQVFEAGRSVVISQAQTQPWSEGVRAMIQARGIQGLLNVPLMMQGQTIGLIIVTTDQVGRVFTTTEVSLAETIAGQVAGAIEIARLFYEERQQRHIAQSRTQELDAFAHTVAHDLQGPLGVVIGFVDYLVQDFAKLEAAELDEALRRIQNASHKASNIVDELLLLASVRKEDVPTKPVDTAAVVEQARQRLVEMIKEYQGEIILPKTWPVARGYAPWLEEVWVNYLSNGLKYGGKPPRLELGATRQPDNMIRFWVRDNGRGIPPAAQATLFTEFTRLNKVRAQGHGLGLSIVRRIVEKLGGQVGVQNIEGAGVGTEFYFTLPAAET